MLIKTTHLSLRFIQDLSNSRLVFQFILNRNFKLTSTSRRLSNSEATTSLSQVISDVDRNVSEDFDSYQAVNENMGKRKQKPNNPNINHPKKMQKFQQDQDHEHIEHYIDNGMRKIKPYIFTFETHAKGRWFGKKMMDVFKKEFRMETPLYYKTAIEGGLIKLNGKTVTPNRVIRNQDFLQSMVHRHEPPVSGEPLDIIAQTEDFIVIDKPSSIPIHPAGKYRHNSLVYIMAREHGLKGLHTFYRLDRLTSGVFIFARSVEVVKKVDIQVRGRELHKVYLCKVNGEFPSEPIECSEPIFTVSHKIGVCRVSPEGKPSKTLFQRVSYDGETSIIKCLPHTGRMHQIRVHLQYLGFPILNDPLYTGPVWGPEQGKNGNMPYDNDDEFIKELTRLHNKEQMENQMKLDCEDLVSKLDNDVQARNQVTVENKLSSRVDQQTTVDCTNVGQVMTSQGESRNTASTTGDECLSSKSGVSVVAANEHIFDRTSTKADDTGSVTMVTKEDVDREVTENHMVIDENISCENNLIETRPTSSTLDKESSTKSVDSNGRTQNKDLGEDMYTVSKIHGASDVPEASLTSGSKPLCSTISNPNDSEMSEQCEIAQGKVPVTDTSLGDTRSDICKIAQGKDTVTDVSLATQSKTPHCSDTTHVASERNNAAGDLTTSIDLKGEGSSCGGSTADNSEEEALNRLALELCRECRHPLPDPEPESMVMYLHALSYKGPDFEFSTPVPKWATEHMERTGSQMP
ncbi:uncharacterized protein [Amphiura filiformis]|uniref:uncharacterized protein n=1 Tax=Amphiura filiformis TaxID=82378 RepID=UPI003B21CBB9